MPRPGTSAQLDLGLEVGTFDQDLGSSVELHDGLVGLGEPKGVVYTKPWVVDLILDLAGYRPEQDLAGRYVVEPSAGEGAFFGPMVRRLLASVRQYGRSLSDARFALHAYELDEGSAAQAITLAAKGLGEWGASPAEAEAIARSWVTVGD